MYTQQAHRLWPVQAVRPGAAQAGRWSLAFSQHVLSPSPGYAFHELLDSQTSISPRASCKLAIHRHIDYGQYKLYAGSSAGDDGGESDDLSSAPGDEDEDVDDVESWHAS